MATSTVTFLIGTACVANSAADADERTHLLFFNDHALESRQNLERRQGQPQLLSVYTDPHNLTMNWAFPTVLPCGLSAAAGGGKGYCMLYQGFIGTTAAQGWEGRPLAKFGVVAESKDGVVWRPRDTRQTTVPRRPHRRRRRRRRLEDLRSRHVHRCPRRNSATTAAAAEAAAAAAAAAAYRTLSLRSRFCSALRALRVPPLPKFWCMAEGPDRPS